MMNTMDPLYRNPDGIPVRSAFTLIELLVVVSIIVVLAALLLPAIGLVKSAAESAKCTSNMRQITAATLTYMGESDGCLPLAGENWSFTGWWWPHYGRWYHTLESYTETYRLFNCPTSTKLMGKYAVRDQDVGSTPRGRADDGWNCLYAYNTANWGRFPDMPVPKGPMTERKVAAQLTATNPAYKAINCPLFTDGVKFFDVTKTGTYAYFLNNEWGVYFPHRKKQSTGYIDGRVKSSSYADFEITSTNGYTGAIQVY